MPIYDNNGTTSSILGKIYDNNGTTSYEIGKVYDNNGTTSYEVFSSAVTVTDLVVFKGWTIAAHESRQAGVNTTDETSTVNVSTGIVLYGSIPSAGLNTGGDIYQNITLTNGHKYWVTYGVYGFGAGNGSDLDPTSLTCKVPGSTTTRTGNFGAVNYATVWTSNTSGSFQVRFTSNNHDDAYCRLSYCTCVDLTAAFGSGSEPDNTWCTNNIGVALDGSKTIET